MKNQKNMLLTGIVALAFFSVLSTASNVFATDEASIPNGSGMNSDESVIVSVGTDTSETTSIIPDSQGSANGNETGSLIPATQGSNNGNETASLTPNTGVSDASEDGTDTFVAPVVPVTPVPTVTPANPVLSGSSYGGSSFSSSGGGYYTILPINPGTTTCPLISSKVILEKGRSNDAAQVSRLQIFLKNSQELNVDVTGIFDQKTEDAVRAFQSSYINAIMAPWGATGPSGIVYITTSKKINELACKQPLALNAQELAIIKSYKDNGGNSEAQSDVVGSAVTNTTVDGLAVSTANSGTSSANVDSTKVVGPENTAAVAKSSILSRFIKFVVSLFR